MADPLTQLHLPTRLDITLVERKLAKSRTHAKKLIQEGKVQVICKGVQLSALKPSTLIDTDSIIDVQKHNEDKYVSRAGLKLAHALSQCNIKIDNTICIDIGQSTGGFTDCLLQHDAKHVVGIEVGHGQLSPVLQADKRVTCIEGCNARNLSSGSLIDSEYSLFDVAVMDVSFISQTLIIPNIAPLLTPDGWFISLVKPQFEVGKAGVGKGGIVKNTALYDEVKTSIIACITRHGFSVKEYIASPIEGGDGNKEFLIIAKKTSALL